MASIPAVVAGQVLAGAVIDHYDLLDAHLRPMDLTRAIVLAVVLLGVWLTVK